jgi:hypothetical protein
MWELKGMRELSEWRELQGVRESSERVEAGAGVE